MIDFSGCVYFFRHIGITPVKIGYSSNKSPKNRFESFRTYAPYGAEILGFIITDNPVGLEKSLHSRFKDKRLSGEWFEINDEEVSMAISYYSNIEDVKRKNEFEIEWSNKVFNEGLAELEDFNLMFSTIKDEVFSEPIVLNQGELMDELDSSRAEVKNIAHRLRLKYKSHRNGDDIKQGYLLYKKKDYFSDNTEV